MNRITFMTSIIVLTILLSCNRTDFTNPEEVIKSYRALTNGKKYEKVYNEFLSSKSKEFLTIDEFLKARYIGDSILNLQTLLERKVSSFPADVNNSTYRRFKVDEKSIFNKDTIYNRYYYTLINENGKWKVIWTYTLLDFAQKKYTDGNYPEARKALEKIIEIDPFSGEIYDFLAWCYLRDNSLTRNEWENGIVKNVKYAITLEEDNFDHYNTLAAYYSTVGNTDLAIQNYEKGLSYCQNSSEKSVFYSNLVGAYISKGEFEKAENCVKKSIEIDDNDAYVWFTYGRLMQEQNNNNKAIEYFEKALKQDKMDIVLQGDLYYSYSLSCLKNGDCDTAKEYINKALYIDPNNNTYLSLFNQRKYCN